MTRLKHPHTPHMPFSRSRTDDDKVLKTMAHFVGRSGVATKKMDGENTSFYRDGFHARSIDSRHHPSRDWVAAFHGRIAHEIPDGWRIGGENLYARHSLGYDDLPSYFLGFFVWDEHNVALGWDDTLDFFQAIGISPVPEIEGTRGLFDEKKLRALARGWNVERDEGFVYRVEGPICFEDFGLSVAKWVRPRHVQTNEHWMHQAVVPNGLLRA